MQDDPPKYIKIVAVGDSGVGKSNILSRYLEGKFSVGTSTTIGLEFFEKPFSVKGENLILQVWDTAGQQRFRALNKTFYKNSLGALVVFSLTERNTFENLGKWVKELRENMNEEAVLLLLGNKCDLKDQTVSASEAMEFARKEEMGYMEVSAALNINIDTSFTTLAEKIVEVVQSTRREESKVQPIKIVVVQKESVQKKKKCCQ